MSYWERFSNRRMSRRALMRSGAIAASGLAGAALIGCGGSDGSAGSSGAAGSAPATATGTAASAGATTAAAAGEPRDGGRLTIGHRFDNSGATADPHITGHLQLSLWDMAGNKLLRMHGATLEIEPDLASSWEHIDELTTVFTLRDDVHFHDVEPTNGRQFTAEDVVWSWERLTRDDPQYLYKGEFGKVDSFEAVDTFTARINNLEPFAPLDQLVAWRNHLMLAREVEGHFGSGMDSLDAVIGTGPFILDSHEAGVGHRFRKNPNYHEQGLPHLDGIDVIYVTDTARATALFQSGQIDLLNRLGPLDYENLKRSNPDYTYQEKNNSGGGGSSIWPNNIAGPFTDARVRRALSHSIPRWEIAGAVWQNTTLPTGAMNTRFQSRWAFPIEELQQFPGYAKDKAADYAESRKLLAAAGFADGLNVDAITINYPGWEQYYTQPAQLIQPAISEGGFNVKLRVLDIGEYGEASRAKDFDISIIAQQGVEDPITIFNELHSSRQDYWANPEMDAQIEAMLQDLDFESRKEKVRALERSIIDEKFPRLYTVDTPTVWGGLTPRVHNYDHSRILNSYWPVQRSWVDA